MKKKTLLFMMVTFMSFALVLSGCNSGTKDAASPSPSEEAVAPAASTAPSVAPTEEVKDLSGTIDFWTFDETGSKLLADAFMAKYPKVTIKTSLLSWDDLPKNLQTTIAAGSGAPDVAYIEGGMFGKFVNNEGLEDLLAEPYNAARYQDQFVSGNWNRWLSLDGQKLLGFPWDQPPMVTFYRPDILEEAGYPSDPAGFGELLQDQTKVMEMAQALKAKGIFTFEFSQTPIDMLTSKVGFWDHDLNYLRNTDEFATALDLSKQIKQMGLALDQSSFWSDEGKAAMTGGKLLMVTFGTWAQGQLKDLGEDQIGKWKATNLPFGNYVGNGGSTMVIPSQAKNKELAWEFIQFSLASQEGQDAG